MKRIELKPLEHMCVNGAREPCHHYVTLVWTPGFVEVNRMRSDGRCLTRILLTEAEALELSSALKKVILDVD